MKKFINPEIQIKDLSPVKSVMDDITLSAQPQFTGQEITVEDTSDEAVW